MPFNPCALSLIASAAPVSHTSALNSPLSWKAKRIVSPVTGMALRTDRWQFAVYPSGTMHVGTVTLTPGNPTDPRDIELTALSVARQQITVQIRFTADGTCGDLVVNLSP
jgi:hypothetical protein